ncbi:MAG: DUF4249 domain-containing protein [Bacteroidales bacterium]|nr:DUF4249 domain-containing protein [Bacteroidales bacterium]
MNQLYKIGVIFLLIFFTTSCIDSFTPQIRSSDTNKYVVMGNVNNSDSIQTVNISVTSSVSKPEYIGVTGCTVNIIDRHGNTFPLSDWGNGKYSGHVNSQDIVSGNSFKLFIKTPSGETIESDYDTAYSCPPVDSVYYKITTEYSNNQITDGTKGIQIYIDLNANESESHYYKWNLIETWEYHSKWPIVWYYDGTIHKASPPDYSKMICWETLPVPNIYILNTTNLTQNKYKQFPLVFVGNNTTRLEYGYSLLIKQDALSKQAYNFWYRMRLNNTPNEGLYTSQPVTVQGNLHNLTNPEKEVLGFFGTTISNEKRIFIQNTGLDMNYSKFCNLDTLRSNLGLRQILPNDYPAYLVTDSLTGGYQLILMTSECVNCLLLGGTTEKPSFWPDKK